MFIYFFFFRYKCRAAFSAVQSHSGGGEFFRVGGGVHDSYTFQCGLVGYFTSPGIDTRYKGPTAFSVSSERHWQGGVNGIAKVPKRSCPQRDSNPSRNVRSPVQANALAHSATAPPYFLKHHQHNTGKDDGKAMKYRHATDIVSVMYKYTYIVSYNLLRKWGIHEVQ